MNKLIIANWKMNGSLAKITQDLSAYTTNPISNQANVAVALPMLYIPTAAQIIAANQSKLSLACQDVSKFANHGAYTGEISGEMLKEFKVRYAIIGHSERRMFLHENNHTLIKKMDEAITSGLIPVFCIGEEKSVRTSGKYIEFLTTQLELLHQVEEPITQLVIAYEPIWSIGTHVLPSPQEIMEIMQLIHTFVQNYLPHAKITALYGGSVGANNAKEILSLQGVAGVLVGGASLNVDDFTAICSAI